LRLPRQPRIRGVCPPTLASKKAKCKVFRTIDISFLEGATHGGAVFDVDTGAGGSHSAGPRGQGCDRHGPDRNRQDTGIFDSCDGKAVRAEVAGIAALVLVPTRELAMQVVAQYDALRSNGQSCSS